MSNISGILSSDPSVFGSVAYSHQNSMPANISQKKDNFSLPTGNNFANQFDSLNISDEGREAATNAQQSQKTIADAVLAEQAKAEQIKTVVGGGTLDSGATVSVYTLEYAEEEERPEGASDKKIMAEITREDGSIETLTITEDTVISEDEHGNLLVSNGQENTGQVGDLQGNILGTVHGTSGNDVIIAMSGSASISSGDGDDTIIFVGNSSGSEVLVGSGNKKIIAGGDVNGLTIAQEGNKDDGIVGNISVTVKGDVRDLILNSWDGDTDVKIEGDVNKLNVSSWNGDNNVKVEGDANNLSIAAHNGSNSLLVKRHLDGLIMGALGESIYNNLSVAGNANDVEMATVSGKTNVAIGGMGRRVTVHEGSGGSNVAIGMDANSLFDEKPKEKAAVGPHIDIMDGGALTSETTKENKEEDVSILGNVSGLKTNLSDGLNNFLLKDDANFLDDQSENGKDNIFNEDDVEHITTNTGKGNGNVSTDDEIDDSNINIGTEDDKFTIDGITYSL